MTHWLRVRYYALRYYWLRENLADARVDWESALHLGGYSARCEFPQ